MSPAEADHIVTFVRLSWLAGISARECAAVVQQHLHCSLFRNVALPVALIPRCYEYLDKIAAHPRPFDFRKLLSQ